MSKNLFIVFLLILASQCATSMQPPHRNEVPPLPGPAPVYLPPPGPPPGYTQPSHAGAEQVVPPPPNPALFNLPPNGPPPHDGTRTDSKSPPPLYTEELPPPPKSDNIPPVHSLDSVPDPTQQVFPVTQEKKKKKKKTASMVSTDDTSDNDTDDTSSLLKSHIQLVNGDIFDIASLSRGTITRMNEVLNMLVSQASVVDRVIVSSTVLQFLLVITAPIIIRVKDNFLVVFPDTTYKCVSQHMLYSLPVDKPLLVPVFENFDEFQMGNGEGKSVYSLFFKTSFWSLTLERKAVPATMTSLQLHRDKELASIYDAYNKTFLQSHTSPFPNSEMCVLFVSRLALTTLQHDSIIVVNVELPNKSFLLENKSFLLERTGNVSEISKKQIADIDFKRIPVFDTFTLSRQNPDMVKVFLQCGRWSTTRFVLNTKAPKQFIGPNIDFESFVRLFNTLYNVMTDDGPAGMPFKKAVQREHLPNVNATYQPFRRVLCPKQTIQSLDLGLIIDVSGSMGVDEFARNALHVDVAKKHFQKCLEQKHVSPLPHMLNQYRLARAFLCMIGVIMEKYKEGIKSVSIAYFSGFENPPALDMFIHSFEEFETYISNFENLMKKLGSCFGFTHLRLSPEMTQFLNRKDAIVFLFTDGQITPTYDNKQQKKDTTSLQEMLSIVNSALQTVMVVVYDGGALNLGLDVFGFVRAVRTATTGNRRYNTYLCDETGSGKLRCLAEVPQEQQVLSECGTVPSVEPIIPVVHRVDLVDMTTDVRIQGKNVKIGSSLLQVFFAISRMTRPELVEQYKKLIEHINKLRGDNAIVRPVMSLLLKGILIDVKRKHFESLVLKFKTIPASVFDPDNNKAYDAINEFCKPKSVQAEISQVVIDIKNPKQNARCVRMIECFRPDAAIPHKNPLNLKAHTPFRQVAETSNTVTVCGAKTPMQNLMRFLRITDSMQKVDINCRVTPAADTPANYRVGFMVLKPNVDCSPDVFNKGLQHLGQILHLEGKTLQQVVNSETPSGTVVVSRFASIYVPDNKMESKYTKPACETNYMSHISYERQTPTIMRITVRLGEERAESFTVNQSGDLIIAIISSIANNATMTLESSVNFETKLDEILLSEATPVSAPVPVSVPVSASAPVPVHNAKKVGTQIPPLMQFNFSVPPPAIGGPRFGITFQDGFKYCALSPNHASMTPFMSSFTAARLANIITPANVECVLKCLLGGLVSGLPPYIVMCSDPDILEALCFYVQTVFAQDPSMIMSYLPTCLGKETSFQYDMAQLHDILMIHCESLQVFDPADFVVSVFSEQVMRDSSLLVYLKEILGKIVELPILVNLCSANTFEDVINHCCKLTNILAMKNDILPILVQILRLLPLYPKSFCNPPSVMTTANILKVIAIIHARLPHVQNVVSQINHTRTQRNLLVCRYHNSLQKDMERCSSATTMPITLFPLLTQPDPGVLRICFPNWNGDVEAPYSECDYTNAASDLVISTYKGMKMKTCVYVCADTSTLLEAGLITITEFQKFPPHSFLVVNQEHSEIADNSSMFHIGDVPLENFGKIVEFFAITAKHYPNKDFSSIHSYFKRMVNLMKSLIENNIFATDITSFASIVTAIMQKNLELGLNIEELRSSFEVSCNLCFASLSKEKACIYPNVPMSPVCIECLSKSSMMAHGKTFQELLASRDNTVLVNPFNRAHCTIREIHTASENAHIEGTCEFIELSNLYKEAQEAIENL